MLQTLGWGPLAYRRADPKVCMAYKIVKRASSADLAYRKYGSLVPNICSV